VRSGTYLQRLAQRSAAVGSVLCLGIDPDPAELPQGFTRDVAGVERFARLLLEAASPYAAAIKLNLAFFEAFGSAGLAALERLRAAIPSEIPVILDAKRADIGSTAQRQAVALFDALDGDAVTVNPYLGGDALAPFFERADRFAYVLCRTSNPGASELQGLVVGQRTLAEEIAILAPKWAPPGRIGLVVGATAATELERIRSLAPGTPFLVPGIGAQGGEIEPVLAFGAANEPPARGHVGGGLLVSVSRAIARAAMASEGSDLAANSDLGERLGAAAHEWAARLPVLSSAAVRG
jgi:orotidine-5'-phosphate decarboxylase